MIINITYKEYYARCYLRICLLSKLTTCSILLLIHLSVSDNAIGMHEVKQNSKKVFNLICIKDVAKYD